MVGGGNETTIGGRRIEIDTPGLLAQIAQHVGYSVVNVVPLDAYQRYGLHVANSMKKESIVLVRA